MAKKFSQLDSILQEILDEENFIDNDDTLDGIVQDDIIEHDYDDHIVNLILDNIDNAEISPMTINDSNDKYYNANELQNIKIIKKDSTDKIINPNLKKKKIRSCKNFDDFN
ncbi:hypothetical protein EBI_25555 [Enterocytozoon bieneusi H348]|nr:hypothetical protein EBI_25555 [Enterocytozoon bieneusi H348]|eukprot:XP_001828075.1 hypothetical protein EBI_25555 [Enterocytozoon bieneusi H348]